MPTRTGFRIRRCWLPSAVLLTGLVNAAATTIGPDTAGYVASDEVPFAFEDISSTGTGVLTNADLAITNASMGFNFNFYGGNNGTVFFSAKGLMTFGGANGFYNNLDLTTNGLTGANFPSIAVLWDDWV